MTFTDEKLLNRHISELMMKEDIDFVARVVSHWHAIGVDALVYDISQRKKEKPSGVIIIYAHPITGFVISEEDFLCRSFTTVRFLFLDLRSRTQESSVSTGKELFNKGLDILLGIVTIIRSKGKRYGKDVRVASPLKPNIGLLRIFRDRRLAGKYSPTFSILDEGLNTYFPNRVWGLIRNSVNQKKGLKHSQLAQFLETKVLRVPYHLLEIIALRYMNTENLVLFRKERDKLIPNESVVNSYRNVIEKRGEVYERTEKTRPLAVVVTQPFSEDWEISLTDELRLIETVINILVKMGFDIVVKPHPRETIDKYSPVLKKFESKGVRVSHHKMPVESLFPSLDPDCVIGYTSTALVMAKILYSIPSITIVDILINKTDIEYLRVAGHEFKKLTRDIAYRADSFEKLKQILDSVKSGLENIENFDSRKQS